MNEKNCGGGSSKANDEDGHNVSGTSQNVAECGDLAKTEWCRQERDSVGEESEGNVQQPQDSPAMSPPSVFFSPSVSVSGVSRAPSDLSNRSQDPPNQQILPENIESEECWSLVRLSESRSSRNEKQKQATSETEANGKEASVSIVIPVGDGRTEPTAPTRRGRQPGPTEEARATLRQRNAHMLFNELMADVYFLIGPPPSSQQQRIPAHSYVLATSSSVFYAMFYGGFAKQGDIPIPDVDPTAFKIMLRYMYTDEVTVNDDSVLATLYASKKYLIGYLTKQCIQYLETSLSHKNVCLLLSQSRLFEEEDLMQRCWELIDAQAEMALRSEGFLDIDYRTFEAILGRETLNARETVVFNAALRWAEAEAKRKGVTPSVNELRRILGDAFYQIRIPAMTIEEFANGPARSGLLDWQETTNIFLWFTAKEKPSLAFVARIRTGLHLRRCHRFQSSAYRSNQWRYRGRCDSIQFSADRRIFVAGIGLYGSSNRAAEYRVNAELKRSGVCLASIETRFFSDGSSSVFPVFFDQPVQIEADVSYTASAILDGSELSYFGQEGMAEVSTNENNCSLNFSFQCSTDSTNGTGVQGGQIPEILFYC